MTTSLWLGLGFVAQALFASRFVVQWVSSEKAGQSVVPIAFWYLSLGGAVLLLTYAIYRKDPVFIIGQSVGGLIYARNLVLISRRRSSEGGETA
jgi:lipid-A-disaccharide synthase-like uncharacterized protein